MFLVIVSMKKIINVKEITKTIKCLCHHSSALEANSFASLRDVITNYLPPDSYSLALHMRWKRKHVKFVDHFNIILFTMFYKDKSSPLFRGRNFHVLITAQLRGADTASYLVFYYMNKMCCILHNNRVNSISPFLYPQCCLHQLLGLKYDVLVAFSKWEKGLALSIWSQLKGAVWPWSRV